MPQGRRRGCGRKGTGCGLGKWKIRENGGEWCVSERGEGGVSDGCELRFYLPGVH